MQALDCLEKFVLKSNIAEGAAAPYKGSWWRKFSVSEGRQSFTSFTCSPSNTGFDTCSTYLNAQPQTGPVILSRVVRLQHLAATMPQIVQHGFESKKLDGLVIIQNYPKLSKSLIIKIIQIMAIDPKNGYWSKIIQQLSKSLSPNLLLQFSSTHRGYWKLLPAHGREPDQLRCLESWSRKRWRTNCLFLEHLDALIIFDIVWWFGYLSLCT